MDFVEKVFLDRFDRGTGLYGDGREFAVKWLYRAARQFAGYQGESYVDAVQALARKFQTEAEIAALPSMTLRAAS